MGNDTVEINAKTGISHYQEYVAKVKKMTLMSDAFASVVFDLYFQKRFSGNENI